MKQHSDIRDMRTPQGNAYAMLQPVHDGLSPLLVLLAMDGRGTLETEPYCRVGRLLHRRGWNVLSLDLPCHGADSRTGEPAQLEGWAARVAACEDMVAAFRERVNDVVAHVIQAGWADPHRIAAAGTSRGGFMAFHAAAGNPRIRAVAAFAPVTDLLALSEFAGQQDNPLAKRLALDQAVPALADRAAWIIIGNDDARVGTDKAVALARALVAAGKAQSLACAVALHVVSEPGHYSGPQWHDDAAAWFADTLVSTVQVLPAASHPQAVPCTVYPPADSDRPGAGLVIHLYGASGSHAFYNLMRPSYNRLRRRLRERGFWLVVPELGPSHWMNPRAVATLDAIIGGMTAAGTVDPGRVSLLGTSMGAASSLVYAMQRPGRLRSVCALFPITDFAAWVKEQPGYLNLLTHAHGIAADEQAARLRELSPLRHAAAFRHTPVYLLHGDADSVVPVHHSRDFAAALQAVGGAVTYREVGGIGHTDEIAIGWEMEMAEFLTGTGEE